jgi:hypothetical protein|nr:MAG TPA: hypothetical protein [Caudoviricetes sp.]
MRDRKTEGTDVHIAKPHRLFRLRSKVYLGFPKCIFSFYPAGKNVIRRSYAQLFRILMSSPVILGTDLGLNNL